MPRPQYGTPTPAGAGATATDRQPPSPADGPADPGRGGL